jgi:hypothetical protein
MRARTRLVKVSLAVTCIIAVAMSAWPSAIGRMQTEDTNHDGSPDVWRYYDARGELTHVAIDSNFDGHPDRDEQYREGSLWRRETDRNFDERVDLVEEFDPETHAPLKSIVDVDFDGRADLRVLFQDGQPVHSEWARAVVGAEQDDASAPSAAGLIALFDPFAQTAAFGRTQPAHVADTVAVAVDSLPIDRSNTFSVVLPRQELTSLVDSSPRRNAFSPVSPRAPPSQTL